MDFADLNGTTSSRPRINGVLRFLIAAVAILVMCGIAFAASPNAAGMNGTTTSVHK